MSMSGVRLRGVELSPDEGARSSEQLRCVEFALRQSPKNVLRPALQGLKRAAEAKRCQRIAGRLATLAGANRQRTAHHGLFRQELGKPAHASFRGHFARAGTDGAARAKPN